MDTQQVKATHVSGTPQTHQITLYTLEAKTSHRISEAKRHKASTEKLDGVGPVDNRPSTDQLHRFVKKKIHVTPDT